MIITIDGPAGSGKSTIAKMLAEKLNFHFFDTGAMYRSVTYFLDSQQIDINDEKNVIDVLENNFNFEISTENNEKRYVVNGKDISKEIRTHDISERVSIIAAYKYIRNQVVKLQRKFAENCDAVFEGRDMGTVVFPYADIKFFLTASAEIRAQRRYLELKEKFPEKQNEISFEKILKDIEIRDERDSTRKESPLKQAEDAILIDTSKKNAFEIYKKLYKKSKKYIKRKKNPRPFFFKMKPFYAIILFFTWIFFKIFYRLKVYGIENYIKGPAILASNHISFYDPPLLAVSSHEEVHFLAKDSLFNIFFLKWLIRKLNAHPVSRSAQDASTLKEIIKILKAGEKVILFPEGERSFDNKLGKILPGIGFITYMSKCSIIPIYIKGAFEVWDRKKRFPKFLKKISIYYGKPIISSLSNESDKKKFINNINELVFNSLNDLINKNKD